MTFFYEHRRLFEVGNLDGKNSQYEMSSPPNQEVAGDPPKDSLSKCQQQCAIVEQRINGIDRNLVAEGGRSGNTAIWIGEARAERSAHLGEVLKGRPSDVAEVFARENPSVSKSAAEYVRSLFV